MNRRQWSNFSPSLRCRGWAKGSYFCVCVVLTAFQLSCMVLNPAQRASELR